MIWILLFICFFNITNGHGDQKSSLLAKDKSKSGNSIARRIMEEIKFRNVSKQKADILGKKQDYVTSSTKKPESDTISYISTTNDPLTVNVTSENKHEIERVDQNRNDKKPTELATTVIPAAISVIPVSSMTNQNFVSSTIRAKTENSMNNINSIEEILRTEENPVEVATILNKFIQSDEIETTNSLSEGVPTRESEINVTVIPLQVNNMNTENITKQILRSSKNNKETQNLSYLIAKLNHLKKVESEPNIKEEKSITKLLASNMNNSYLNSKTTDYSFESDNGTISGLKNQGVKSITLNFSNNTIMLTFIKRLNIGLDKTNGFNGLGKLGAHNIGNKRHKQEITNNQEWKNLYNIRSNVATENPNYDDYVSQSKNNYFRQSDKSTRMKDDVTPISVDYYFGRNQHEKEFDSDEVVDPSEEESVAVHKNDYVLVNFDEDADELGRSRNEVLLSVLRDMVKTDSKALVEYPWLKSVLEVRSGILKIIDLINSYVYNHKIHHLDLELLKYLLYLHKSSSMKLQISENSPYSRPQLNVNPMEVPILKNLFKNIKKDGSKIRSENEVDQQLTIIFDLQDLMNEVLLLLESFHRKIQDLAQYDTKPTQLYHKLKDEYLEYAKAPHLRVVLLHISLAKLFDYIDSSADRARVGFYNYVQQHPEEVKRDQETSMTILNVLDELRWK